MSDSAPGGSSDRYPTPQTSETSANSQSLDNQWEEVEQELARPLQPVDRSPEATVSKSDYASSTVRSFDGSSPLVMVETAFLASAASLIWLVNFYFPIGPFLRIFFPIWLVSLLLGDDLWLYSTNQVTNLIDWICLRLGILFQPSLTFIQGMVIVLVAINSVIYLFVVHLVAWFLFDRLRNPIPRPPKWVQVLMEYEE